LTNNKMLAIYLNDHLATEVAIVELAKRCSSSNESTPLGDFLNQLVGQLEADRALLAETLGALGMRVNPVKQAAGWMAEKVGRLKPNGQLTGYSPLSRLIELEALSAGVERKLAVWRSLQLVASSDRRLGGLDFDDLIDRTAGQHEALENHRVEAVRQALLSA
jgi:hypothetical protein